MSLRLKFFILFLIISLFPLTIAGWFTFQKIKNEITKRVINQLQTVADTQEKQVHKTLNQYLKQIKLVTANTQLNAALTEYAKTHNRGEFPKIIQDIIEGKDYVSAIEQISIIGTDDIVIASSNVQNIGKNYKVKKFFQPGGKPALYDVFLNEHNALKISLISPVIVNNNTIGIVEIVSSATPLIATVTNYTGLGDTGEAYFIKKINTGDTIFVTPLRFDPKAAFTRTIPKGKINTPSVISAQEQETVFIHKNIVDYREIPILAVTRFIDPLEWKLVVKIDRNEALEPIHALARVYLLIIAVSILLVILISFLVARSITKPIRALTSLAQALQSGDFSKRSRINSKNEIGFLATTFNSMAAKLQELYQELEEKVRARTVQLQEVNAKDEAILAGLGDGLIVTDQTGDITLVNPVFEQLLLWNKKEVIGKKLVALIPMLDANGEPIPELERPITKALLRQNTITTTAIQYKRKDGSIFPTAITVSPIVLEKTIIGAVEIFRDITKEKDIDKVKTEFVSLASHQLRTPMAIINWYTEMLIDGDAGKITPEQKKYLNEICHSNKKMIELVNALLDVSRLELGTIIVEPELTDIVAVAKNIIKNLEPKIMERKINLKEDCDQVMKEVKVDTKLIRIVIENILTNAIKYTPENGKINFSIQKHNDNFLITVKDTGWGIPKNQQDKIFNKLFRADNIKEKSTEGTGLGLYITKTIVDLSGGRIWFESPYLVETSQGKKEEIQGTAFFVELPIAGIVKTTTNT